MHIRNNVFVVTGGGNGIGRAVVLGLLARGAHVAAVDVSEAGLAETARHAASALLSTHTVDLTDRAAVDALPEQVRGTHGRVDGVVNVAGIIHRFAPVSELGEDEIARVMDVNFWSVVRMVRAFLPMLRERPRASLVNVSSMGALGPVPGQTAYGASKAAVKLLTEGLYAELRDTSVAVTVVYPGGISTGIADNSGAGVPGAGEQDAPMKLTTPEQAARKIIIGIRSGSYRVRIGKDAHALDILWRALPRRTTDLVASRMKSLLQ